MKPEIIAAAVARQLEEFRALDAVERAALVSRVDELHREVITLRETTRQPETRSSDADAATRAIAPAMAKSVVQAVYPVLRKQLMADVYEAMAKAFEKVIPIVMRKTVALTTNSVVAPMFKRFVIERGYLRDAGVFKLGESYTRGAGVTWDGSYWIAQRKTLADEKPGDTSGAFRMAVKKGRDGRDR